jgi:hypothetical protein
MKVYNRLSCNLKLGIHSIKGRSFIDLPKDEAGKLIKNHPDLLTKTKPKE